MDGRFALIRFLPIKFVVVRLGVSGTRAGR